MAGIQVPVSLQIQNLQSLVTELQSKLSNLKVGSAGFKSVQNLITGIKNEIDKLQVQTSKPFINESQFTKAENSVDKLEDELQRVEITLSRIKFNDLELNPQQKAELKAFEDQINTIKANLKTVKDTAKQDFLGSAMGKVWSDKFDSTAITKSFSEITKNIRSEVTKQQNIVKEAQQALNDYQNAMKANDSIEQFLKVKNPLEETNLGAEKYAQIFQETKNGLRFRAGGSTILEEWLKSQLDLDDATIKGLVEGSAQKVKAELEKRLKEIKLANTDVINNNVNAQTNYANEDARLTQLNQVMQQLGYSEQAVAVANQALRQQLTDTNDAMANYKDNAVQAMRSNQEVSNTTNAMRIQLDGLRTTLQQTNGEFIRMQRTQQSFNQMKMAVVNFMGFNQVLNLTRNAIRNAINHIRELDSVMNKISIVTDMSTGDLWNQVDAYSKMAQTYGVSIKGAYEVSQIYYQQGLQTNDVLTLTNETLKLAKISGLDYATTTDYMTTAIRGFKMEMSEASRVVDVYSNLAAHTAVSQEELAVAMSKTASSMEAVGATFEESSAMIGTMVAVTRESATNIGSAMKSIASRYGELTKDPTKLVDEEGEAMAFNKVDAALSSVGISMKTVDGQFREFTDVIVELGEKWDQLDSVQQRYIATQFAGNRQQSRFLALVSNVDLLKSNLDVAMNSEDTGTLQALKALDSIEAKTEQVRVAYQQFYTTIGAENVWKGFLDGAKNVINTLNSFPKLFEKLPVGAIMAVTSIVNVIKEIGIKAITGIAEIFGSGLLKGFTTAEAAAARGAEGIFSNFINTLKSKLGIAEQTGKELGQAVSNGINSNTNIMSLDQLTGINKTIYDNNTNIINSFNKATSGFTVTDPTDLNEAYQQLAFNMQQSGQISSYIWNEIQAHPEQAKTILETYIQKLQETNNKLLETGDTAEKSGGKLKNFLSEHAGGLGKGLQNFGSALHMVSMMIDTTKEGGKTLSGTLMTISGAATLAGIGVQALNGALDSIPWMAIATGVFALINGISTLFITPEERLEELIQKAEDLNNKAKEARAEYRTLDNSIKKLDELKEKRYESAEAAEEYQTAVDELAEKFPEMISGFDDAGNIIIDTTNAEYVLTEARKKAAEAAASAAKAEYDRIKEEAKQKKEDISSYKEGTSGAGLGHYTFRADDYINNAEVSPELAKALKNLNPYFSYNGEGAEKDITSKEGQATLQELQRVLSDKTIQFYDLESLESLKEAFNTVIQANSDFNKLINTSEGYAKQIVSSWMLVNDANDHIQTFLYNSTGALAIVTNAITDDILSGGFEINDKNAKIMDDRHGYQIAMNNFISSLSKERLELFNQMYNAQDIYSAQDFKVEFGKELNWNDNVYEMIQRYYSDSSAAILDRLQNSLQQSITYTDKTGNVQLKEDNDFYNKYASIISQASSIAQEQFLNGILSQYNVLVNEGFYSQAIESGLASLNIFSMLKGIESLDISVYSNLISSISDYNLNTKTGIEEFIAYIESTDTDLDDTLIEPLNTLKETLFSNISLTIQSITTEVVDNWSDNSKLLSKLTTGLDLSDVNTIITQAQKYNLTDSNGQPITIDFKDFQTNGDKLILIQKKANAYWNAYFTEQQNKIQTTESELDAAIAQLAGENFDQAARQILSDTIIQNVSGTVNSEIAELYKTILGGDFETYFKPIIDEASGEETGEFEVLQNNEVSLNDAVINAYNNNRDLILQYYQYLNWQRAEIDKPEQWSKGNYSSLLQTFYRNNIDSLNNDLLNLSKFDAKERLSQIGKIAPDVINAVTQIQETTDKLISDALNQGLDNLVLSDYAALPITIDINTSYQDFIIAYAQYAGKSIDETNDLLLQAIQKDNETKSIDLIKDLEFFNETQFKTNLSGLNELANKIDTPLADILRDAVISYNEALDEYIIDATRIDNLDLSSIEFQNTIKNSVQEFFESLASYISSALKGNLSTDDARELQKFATNQGIGQLNFTQTADGLKLANDSARKVVAEVEKLDALQGQVLFSELAETLIETEDAFESISSTTAYIKNLETELAQLRKQEETPDNKKRIEALEQELRLAEEINEIRSTTEDDSFKFMDNKIPSGQNNPLNYWSNWYDAFAKMKKTSYKGKDRGKMAYEDFYNIVTEMGHIAEISGTAVNIGGKTLENSQQAADLITQAAGALTNMSTGDMGVKLSAIGINFSSGVDKMAAGVDEGIDALAQEQIDMLDSMIALLETIVAMEDLGNLDVDHDMVISVPELLLDTDGVERGIRDAEGFIEKFGGRYTTIIEKIVNSFTTDDNGQTVLDQVTANGHTFTQIFNATEAQLKEWGITASDLSILLTNLYQIISSNNFDLDKPWESFLEIFQGMEWGNLTIGANAGSHQIILSDKGVYSIKYDSVAAIKKLRESIPSFAEKNDEEIITAAKEAIDKSSRGDKLEIDENAILHILNNDIVIKKEDGKTTYSVNGITGSYDNYKDAVAAADIISVPNVIDIEVSGGEARGVITIDDKSIDITSEGTGAKYYYNGTLCNTLEQAYQALYEETTNKAATTEDGIKTEEYKTWEIQQGITIVPTITVGGQSTNLTYDVQTRQAIDNLYHQADDALVKQFGNPVNGVYTAQLDHGVAIQLKSEDIQVNGKADATKIREKLAESLGVDSTLANTISEGIKGAFGENGIPLDKLKIVPETIGIDGESVVLTEPIATATGEVKELQLTLENTEQTITITPSQLNIAPGETPATLTVTEITTDPVTGKPTSITLTSTADNTALSNIADIEYNEKVTATLKNLIASYTGVPESNITINGNLKPEVLTATALLTSLIVNASPTDTTVTPGTININGKQINIPTPLEGIVQKLKVNTGENTEEDTSSITSVKKPAKIAVIDGEVISVAVKTTDKTTATLPSYSPKETLSIEEIQALIEFINFVLSESAKEQPGPTLSELGYDTDIYSKDTITYHQAYKVELESEGQQYNDIRKALYNYSGTLASGIQTKEQQLNDLKKFGLDINSWAITEKYNFNGARENTPNIQQYVNYLQDLVSKGQMLSTVDLSNLQKLQNFGAELNSEQFSQVTDIIAENAILMDSLPVDKLQQLSDGFSALSGSKELIQALIETLTTLEEHLNTIDTISPEIDITVNNETALAKLQAVIDKLGLIQNKDVTVTTTNINNDTSAGNHINNRTNEVHAKGNVALAQGTLMGELGPELYVTGGRYYVAGQNGAEFVNLPDDAIVFNHLQTRSLMNNGRSSRGKAYTSEERALAFATGNWNGGQAMASAASALSSLKQLRAMWQSLQSLTAKDLAGAAGGGGGGGGSKSESNKAFLKDLEKWYNWLQKIAQLETDITYQEQLRSKIQSDMVSHGQDYFQSQLVTLDKLEQSVTTRQDLVNSQEEYFNTRRQELNDQAYPFSSLYEFDEAGQLKYKDGQLANLSKLMGTNQYGEANYTAQEQYEMIVAMDPRFEEYMQYNDSGEKIEWEKDDEGNWKNEDYVTAVENFWNKIETDREEMQSLHDSVEEGKKDILADYESINEILKDIEDNQISVENKVYEALVDSRERAIEELEDTKDAIEDSANKLINGLQAQLNNEKEMYDQQANADELTKLQRQLGILQRSGASAAEIAGLQAQITEKQYDAYFDEQQRQIDAIQEASDNELEKLQQQIDLETEMLEYEKEYGLLWSQVYDIMHGENAEGIAAYIAKNNSEYWGKSPTEFLKTQREDLFEAQAYKDFTDRFEGIETLINHYNNTNVGLGNNAELADQATNTINGTTSTTSANASTQSSGSGSATKSAVKGSWKQDNKGWWYENPDGSYKQNEWMQEDGIWYYFDENGYMVTGSRAIDGKNYSFNGSGGLIGEDNVKNTGNSNEHGWKITLNYWDNGEVFSVEGKGKTYTDAEDAAFKKIKSKEGQSNYWTANAEKYKQGGLNDYTGPAILHGTKNKPEAVLNASQTAILRDEILSNKPDSLLSLLTTWRDSVIGLADTSAINNNYTDGVNIEKAEVIMQVSSIANDYDAQRAGEQALDKIINVARKTMAQNRIRR